MKKTISFATILVLFFITHCLGAPDAEEYSLAAPQEVIVAGAVLSWTDDVSSGASGYKVEAFKNEKWKMMWRGTNPRQRRWVLSDELQDLKLRVLAYRADEQNGDATIAQVVPQDTDFLSVAALPDAGVGKAGEPSSFGLSNNPRISYDRRLGKLGTAPGMFSNPVDFCFSGQNSEFVYVLERNRVQKIALTETFTGEVSLAQYSLKSVTKGSHIPSALALTTEGGAVKIWVAYPTRNALVCIEEDGTSRLCTYEGAAFPNGIYALGTHNNRVYAVGYASGDVEDGRLASKVAIINADGSLFSWVKLSRGLQFAKRLEIDSAGNIFIQAWRWQIFKFSPTGNLLRTYGNGFQYPNVTTAPRGVAFHHSFALGHDDNLYTMRSGELIRIQGSTLSFCRPLLSSTGLLMGGVSSFPERIPGTIFRVDNHNRLWVLTLSSTEAGGFGSDNRPLLVRVCEDVFSNKALSPTSFEESEAGYAPALEHGEPYGLYYETGTGHINVKFAPGPKPRSHLVCRWALSDHTGQVLQEGEAPVPLAEAASLKSIPFAIPRNGALPRYGWFNFKADFFGEEGTSLFSRSKHIAVTPAWPSLVEPARTLEADESAGGAYDPERAGWAGQIIRFHCSGLSPKSIARVREQALQCKKYNVPCFLQITSKEEIMSEDGKVNTANLVGLVEGLGDVIKHFEIINEPTTGYTPLKIPQYIEYLKAARTVIKSTDPSIQILGPALVSLSLPKIEEFLALGGGKLIDEFSIHDYEGNNAIYATLREPKWDKVRELLKEYKVGHKPMWQTEHGTLAIFANVLYPFQQMSRIALQRDINARSGVPPSRNAIFYLNDHGFGDFKSWIWNRDGAYPAALACRTHWALVGRKPFTDQLDFGSVGNSLYHGVGYGDDSGVVYSLQDLGVVNPQPGFEATLGARDGKMLDFAVGGAGASATVYDVFGNKSDVPVNGGVLSLRLTQSPQFVVLSAGGTLTAPVVDFGPNQSAGTTFSWSGSQEEFKWNDTTKGDDNKRQNLKQLTDGITTPTHNLWLGNLAAREGTEEQGTLIDFGASLSASFAPKNISRIVLYGTEADNNVCTLMDYDLEVQKPDGSFEMVHQVRYNESPLLRTTLDPALAIGYLDTSKTHVLEFSPRDAIGYRLTVLRTSYNTEQSFEAQQIRRGLFGSGMPANLSLAEITVH